jgi:hypothetical protein
MRPAARARERITNFLIWVTPWIGKSEDRKLFGDGSEVDKERVR